MSRPRINLLPYRQERRAQKQREFAFLAVAAAIVGIVIVIFGIQVLNAQLENQQDRNVLLQTGISALDQEIKEIDALRAKIRVAVDRKKTVESLQNTRTTAVHLMDQMIRQLPEGVYLNKATQKADNITVTGYAQSNAHVSTFMRNIEGSEWIESPQLVVTQVVEVKDSTPGQKKGDGMQPKTAYEFTMKFKIKTVRNKPTTNPATGQKGA
ncbi:MAG: PilN domain-containing protein [Burkholderiales bacterium]|jgi:type IV pilus assembly protein PilN|nr:PilN domain-containing protein [Burkholderiales bacterium]